MYDFRKAPAVLLFHDSTCSNNPGRFYWNKEDTDGTEYNSKDLNVQDAGGSEYSFTKAAMVPPGYDIYLYP